MSLSTTLVQDGGNLMITDNGVFPNPSMDIVQSVQVLSQLKNLEMEVDFLLNFYLTEKLNKMLIPVILFLVLKKLLNLLLWEPQLKKVL